MHRLKRLLLVLSALASCFALPRSSMDSYLLYPCSRASLYLFLPRSRTADLAQASLSAGLRPNLLPVGVPEGEGV